MKKYLIDASVILTVLLGENEKIADRFRKLLKETEKSQAMLYSTPLLMLEVGNGLRFSLNDNAVAQNVYDKFSALPIEYFSLDLDKVSGSIALAYRLKTSVYDSSYHVVANLLGVTYLTCDKQYFERAKGEDNIELLS